MKYGQRLQAEPAATSAKHRRLDLPRFTAYSNDDYRLLGDTDSSQKRTLPIRQCWTRARARGRFRRRGIRIGELAKQCGVKVQTLRFYERRGLLPEPP